jgi:hypothetical protein
MRSDSILTAGKEVVVADKEEPCCLLGELILYRNHPQSHLFQERQGQEDYMEVEGKEVKHLSSRSQVTLSKL